LLPVRQLEQVEIGIRHHDKLGLSSDPSSHVNVAVRSSRPGFVGIQANTGLAAFTISASAAGDIERHGNDVPDIDELDVATGLDHLTRDLMTQYQPRRHSGASAHHVLIAAADVGRQNFQNNAVMALAGPQREFGKIDAMQLNQSRLDVNNASIPLHD
jgi:hypothetical protein